MNYSIRRFHPQTDILHPFDCGVADLNVFLLEADANTPNASLYDKELLAVTYVAVDHATQSILALCAIINITGGLDWMTGLTASVACIGNVGPGFGEVGSMANYAAVPTLLKCTGMLEMLIGRLEILPMLYLLRALIRH